MRIAYTRVSTEDQKLDRQAIDAAEKVFAEKASGANRDRPALRELIDYAREGDTVIVHSLDRLARDLRDLKAIVEELNAKGVTVEFVKERLTFAAGDEADPMARLLFHVMGAFAEFERSIIKQRQREGIAQAKARGVYKGRKPSIDAAEVRRLRDQERLGATEIAKRLGIGRASVYRVLDQDALPG